MWRAYAYRSQCVLTTLLVRMPVGTARALQESEESGAFAALAMSLMGMLTAVLLPLVIALVA